MATKARKDSRGYALKKGESQRKDGRYVFRYTTIRGEQKAVYAKELSELRKKEVKIRRAIEDGLDPDRAERITLNELFDEYISQKYDLKQSTLKTTNICTTTMSGSISGNDASARSNIRM